MRDPLLIAQGEQRIPDEWRRKYTHERTLEQIRIDVTGLYDRNWTLRKKNDELLASLLRAQKRLDAANLKIWIMSLIVSPIIGLILKAIWAKVFS